MKTARNTGFPGRVRSLLLLAFLAAGLLAAPAAQALVNCTPEFAGDESREELNIICANTTCDPSYNSTDFYLYCTEGEMTCLIDPSTDDIGWYCQAGEEWLDGCRLALPKFLSGDRLELIELRNGTNDLSGVSLEGWFGDLGYTSLFNNSDKTVDTVEVVYWERSKYTYNYLLDGVKDNSLTYVSTWRYYGTEETFTPDGTRNVGGQDYILTGWSGATGALQTGLGGASGTISSPGTFDVTFTVNQNDCEVNWEYTPAYDLTVNLSYTPAATGLDTYADAQPHLGTEIVKKGSLELSVYKVIRTSTSEYWRYLSTGWSEGSGSLAIPGSGSCVENAQGRCAFTANITADSGLTWNYQKQEIFYSTFSDNVPQVVRDNLAPIPPECSDFASCGNWYNHNSQRQPSVSQKAQDNNGIWWACSSWDASINGSSESGSGATGPIFNITQPSWIKWNCGEVRSLDVTVTGLPADMISGFSPNVGAHDVPMGSTLLSAPEEIYDTSGDNRYVLVAYSFNDGSNTTRYEVDPADDECAGATFCRSVNITADSGFNWHYRKEVKLAVGVNGLSADALAGALECGGVDNAEICIGWANTGGAGAIPSGSNYYPENSTVVATAMESVADGGTKTLISAVIFGAPGSTEYAAGGRKSFTFVVMNPVRLIWLYEETDIYDVGQPITVPAGANGTVRPTITMPGQPSDAVWNTYFYWGGNPKRLYAIQPVSTFRVTWTPASGSTPVNSRPSLAKWPDDIQTHIMNAPVNLQPPGSPYSFSKVSYSSIPSDRITTDSGRLGISATGMTVLMFVEGPVADDLNYPVNFVVLETMPWEDSRVVEYPPGTVEIGAPLISGSLPLYRGQPASGTFVAPVPYATGNHPVNQVARDFNGDGLADLAVINSWSTTSLAVLLNQGDGTFGSAFITNLSGSPLAVASDDFDGDGIADLAVAQSSSNQVAVYLGRGDGFFQYASSRGTAAFPYSVTAGDFNDDGYADLATANWTGNNVSVLISNGDGTFQAKMDYDNTYNPRFITTGDFNRDGNLDLVTGNGLSVSVYRGNGDGTFLSQNVSTAGSYVNSVAVGDFDGDGNPDVATANRDTSNVSVLLGNGNGTFAAKTDFPIGGAARSVVAGRFDGDQALDLMVANGGGEIRILSGNGDGSFQDPATLMTVADPETVIAADLNLNGHQDLVISSSSDNSVHVALSEVVPFTHADPEGKNGFVYYARSFFDGVGKKQAYDRNTRSGRIIPVNRAEPGDRDRQMVVIWYAVGANGLGWPVKPALYDCQWPADPEEIVIASGLGYGPLNPSLYPNASIYSQPDTALPGFNPNEEHASIFASTVYAARDDLNTVRGVTTSGPYVLVKYADTSVNPPSWSMKVLGITRGAFSYDIDVGKPLLPPAPLSLWIPYPAANSVVSGEKYQHRTYNGTYWVIASNLPSEPAAAIGMQWHYPMQPGFFYPDFNRDGNPDALEGEPVPFLNGGQNPEDPPLTAFYNPQWPAVYNALKVGQTLTTGGNGLPDVYHMAVARVIYDEGVYGGAGPLAKLMGPMSWRQVSLASLPADLKTERVGGRVRFPDLPFYLRSRLSYNDLSKKLIFEGLFDDTQAGDPFLLLNVMNLRERDKLCDPDDGGSPGWVTTIQDLFTLSRNPNSLTFTGTVQNPYNPDLTHTASEWQDLWGIYLGLDQDGAGNPVPVQLKGVPLALTAGMARGEGWVVLVENDDEELQQPPAVHVMRVEGPPYRGEIRVVDSVDNVFDEKLTLRHTGDFGGEPEKFCFEWRMAEDVTGLPPALPPGGPWVLYDDGEDPCGKLDITIKGSNPRTLTDNWFTARYDYSQAFPFLSAAPGYPWSEYTPAQLAAGWIKRVVSKLNPFEARVRSFHQAETNTLVSMIAQLGERYEGPIAMNSNADNLNSIGLIEAYETVLRQGLLFSIDAVPPTSNEAVNKALLFISSRIANFYALLGNEAYADAVDPTIGIDTESAVYGFGSVAPAVFTFQNQVDSLLDEELVLLRGRDDSTGRVDLRPVYNRLYWNYSGDEGEVAYTISYNISDWTMDGLINEYDAKAMFPQGHGDAWGHYLSALDVYYRLLGHPYYDWVPRAEAMLVAGAPVLVDFQDERKFAAIAANRARAGYDVVDLTYRKYFVDDPAGQWQGYKDTYESRAWGVDEWARRAGQASLFDWVAANAVVPEEALFQDREDEDGNVIPAADIQQIMRSKIPELDAIAGKFQDIQALMDKADRGLNPLGLAKGSVPFDINPAELPDLTHFEQVYERAQKAIINAVTVFDYANSFTRMLRQNQDSLEDFRRSIGEQERDYLNRLIEIYGYPYPEDATYPDGYDGPDLFHFMYVDVPTLTGELPTQGGSPDADVTAYSVDFDFDLDNLDPDLGITQETMTVTYHLNTDRFWLEKPAGWSMRRAPGEIQMALSELIKAHADYQRGLTEYDGLLGGIKDKKDLLEARHGVLSQQIMLLNANNEQLHSLEDDIRYHTMNQVALRRVGEITKDVCDGIVSGMGTDALMPAAIPIAVSAAGVKGVLDIVADVEQMRQLDAEQAKDQFQRGTDIKMAVNDARWEVLQMVKELEAAVTDLIAKKQELYLLREVITQNVGQYLSLQAQGERLLAEREQQRRYAAADVQEYRYQDMAYRVFRNDALQKYRAQFDVAARYVYLAAAAYDYETNLLGSDGGSGRKFLTDIVRQRSLGQLLEGEPVAGQPGLCDPLARLAQNFDVYKTQLGFNNPQFEGNRFSLKKELLRLADEDWPLELAGYRVDDLWMVPEFKRYCRAFAPQNLGAQPGLVIPFSTTVTFGQNFFGNPLGGGDSSYDPTNFATKVRSVGVWFEDYDAAGLSYTPRVYVVPVGADVLRSPTDDTFVTREWKVVDQKLPVPFPIGESDLRQEGWIPLNDTLSEDFGGIRRFSSFRAYHDAGDEDWSHDETTQDTRLVGRSVWNTRWLLIIPGGTLLYDPDVGLDTFIDTITDIKLYFSTYAYSGN